MPKLYRVYFQSVAFVDVEAKDKTEAENLAMLCDPSLYTVNGWEMTDETVDLDEEKSKEDATLEKFKKNAENYLARQAQSKAEFDKK
jgi:hypothetical protein